ncbi:MAG: ABC transporter ATP-binding protein [Bacilli bacterium]|nr:ABC transporter ATP-binding protein [Bacilli bacterium]
MAILEVNNLHVSYGMIKAVKGVSFEVNEGEIVALIGANGAGKTTIIHAISGLLKAKEGTIKLMADKKNKKTGEVTPEQVELTKTAANKIVYLGLSQVPEGRHVFSELSVKDNLLMGAYTRNSKKEIEDTLKNVYEKFPILLERSKQTAGTLSGGEQQMLAVGRAMMAHPKVLLLDEPSMGLSPLYVDIIFKTIKEINKEGTTVVLVEQNAKKALSIADRAYVIETGLITKTGTGKELLEDEDVRKAYLGA